MIHKKFQTYQNDFRGTQVFREEKLIFKNGPENKTPQVEQQENVDSTTKSIDQLIGNANWFVRKLNAGTEKMVLQAAIERFKYHTENIYKQEGLQRSNFLQEYKDFLQKVLNSTDKIINKLSEKQKGLLPKYQNELQTTIKHVQKRINALNENSQMSLQRPLLSFEKYEKNIREHIQKGTDPLTIIKRYKNNADKRFLYEEGIQKNIEKALQKNASISTKEVENLYKWAKAFGRPRLDLRNLRGKFYALKTEEYTKNPTSPIKLHQLQNAIKKYKFTKLYPQIEEAIVTNIDQYIQKNIANIRNLNSNTLWENSSDPNIQEIQNIPQFKNIFEKRHETLRSTPHIYHTPEQHHAYHPYLALTHLAENFRPHIEKKEGKIQSMGELQQKLESMNTQTLPQQLLQNEIQLLYKNNSSGAFTDDIADKIIQRDGLDTYMQIRFASNDPKKDPLQSKLLVEIRFNGITKQDTDTVFNANRVDQIQTFLKKTISNNNTPQDIKTVYSTILQAFEKTTLPTTEDPNHIFENHKAVLQNVKNIIRKNNDNYFVKHNTNKFTFNEGVQIDLEKHHVHYSDINQKNLLNIFSAFNKDQFTEREANSGDAESRRIMMEKRFLAQINQIENLSNEQKKTLEKILNNLTHQSLVSSQGKEGLRTLWNKTEGDKILHEKIRQKIAKEVSDLTANDVRKTLTTLDVSKSPVDRILFIQIYIQQAYIPKKFRNTPKQNSFQRQFQNQTTYLFENNIIAKQNISGFLKRMKEINRYNKNIKLKLDFEEIYNKVKTGHEALQSTDFYPYTALRRNFNQANQYETPRSYESNISAPRWESGGKSKTIPREWNLEIPEDIINIYRNNIQKAKDARDNAQQKLETYRNNISQFSGKKRNTASRNFALQRTVVEKAEKNYLKQVENLANLLTKKGNSGRRQEFMNQVHILEDRQYKLLENKHPKNKRIKLERAKAALKNEQSFNAEEHFKNTKMFLKKNIIAPKKFLPKLKSYAKNFEKNEKYVVSEYARAYKEIVKIFKEDVTNFTLTYKEALHKLQNIEKGASNFTPSKNLFDNAKKALRMYYTTSSPALDLAYKAMRSNPHNAEAQYIYGIAVMKQGDLRSAKKIFDYSLKLLKNNKTTYNNFNESSVHTQLQNLEELKNEENLSLQMQKHIQRYEKKYLKSSAYQEKTKQNNDFFAEDWNLDMKGVLNRVLYAHGPIEEKTYEQIQDINNQIQTLQNQISKTNNPQQKTSLRKQIQTLQSQKEQGSYVPENVKQIRLQNTFLTLKIMYEKGRQTILDQTLSHMSKSAQERHFPEKFSTEMFKEYMIKPYQNPQITDALQHGMYKMATESPNNVVQEHPLMQVILNNVSGGLKMKNTRQLMMNFGTDSLEDLSKDELKKIIQDTNNIYDHNLEQKAQFYFEKNESQEKTLQVKKKVVSALSDPKIKEFGLVKANGERVIIRKDGNLNLSQEKLDFLKHMTIGVGATLGKDFQAVGAGVNMNIFGLNLGKYLKASGDINAGGAIANGTPKLGIEPSFTLDFSELTQDLNDRIEKMALQMSITRLSATLGIRVTPTWAAEATALAAYYKYPGLILGVKKRTDFILNKISGSGNQDRVQMYREHALGKLGLDQHVQFVKNNNGKPQLKAIDPELQAEVQQDMKQFSYLLTGSETQIRYHQKLEQRILKRKVAKRMVDGLTEFVGKYGKNLEETMSTDSQYVADEDSIRGRFQGMVAGVIAGLPLLGEDSVSTNFVLGAVYRIYDTYTDTLEFQKNQKINALKYRSKKTPQELYCTTPESVHSTEDKLESLFGKGNIDIEFDKETNLYILHPKNIETFILDQGNSDIKIPLVKMVRNGKTVIAIGNKAGNEFTQNTYTRKVTDSKGRNMLVMSTRPFRDGYHNPTKSIQEGYTNIFSNGRLEISFDKDGSYKEMNAFNAQGELKGFIDKTPQPGLSGFFEDLFTNTKLNRANLQLMFPEFQEYNEDTQPATIKQSFVKPETQNSFLHQDIINTYEEITPVKHLNRQRVTIDLAGIGGFNYTKVNNENLGNNQAPPQGDNGQNVVDAAIPQGNRGQLVKNDW